ncbi:hypothetical protein PR048_009955 [Dryococelus australis]|uniref:Uncharacterized protein n=1 Tax=Dryococelus australis TaxID=614101 RepID=A0ABQ9I1D5_9NEOP|nr:hypothetical protein PR048_009955 [Dryococelus australis]
MKLTSPEKKFKITVGKLSCQAFLYIPGNVRYPIHEQVFIGDHIVAPYLFPFCLTTRTYVGFLQQLLPEFLEDESDKHMLTSAPLEILFSWWIARGASPRPRAHHEDLHIGDQPALTPTRPEEVWTRVGRG